MEDLGKLVLQRKIGYRLGRQAIAFPHRVEREVVSTSEIYPRHLHLIVHEEEWIYNCVHFYHTVE